MEDNKNIIYIYSIYAKTAEYFTNIMPGTMTPERVQAKYIRDYEQSSAEQRAALKNFRLVLVGEFNDVTGEFTNDKEILLDYDSLDKYIERKEKKKCQEQEEELAKIAAVDSSEEKQTA